MSEEGLATYAPGCNAVRVGHREALGAMSRRAQLLPLVVGCASGALVQGAAAPGGEMTAGASSSSPEVWTRSPPATDVTED